MRLARRAYELGRLGAAVRGAAWVTPFVGLTFLVHGPAPLTLVLGAVLYATCGVLLWRGLHFGRAVGTGLLAGAVPLVVPMAFRSTGACCVAGACWSTCMVACILGGLVAGSFIGARAAAQESSRGAFGLAAAAVAGLAGSLGCVAVGLGGVLGMAAAVLVSAPVFMAARGRAAA
jgi:hypothetical protein